MNKQNGFTFVEVLVFASIFSVFFVTAITIVTFSLRQSQTNMNKLQAEHYANELLTWIRTEKEAYWGGQVYISPNPADSFTELATQNYPGSAITNFCFNSNAIVWTTPIASTVVANCGFNFHTIFRRYAVLSSTISASPLAVTQVVAQVTVEWKEGVNVHKTTIQSAYTLWE